MTGLNYIGICSDNACTGITQEAKTSLFRRIRRKIGEPVMGVELVDEQICECLAESIEEYSSFIHNWALKNRMSQMLGLPSEVDFTLKYVSSNFGFEKSFARAYSEQVVGGINSTRPLLLGGITLSAGTQDYVIPNGREINEVLWFTPSFINLFGLDPFANSNIAFSEFGASFAGHTLYHVMPVFDTIITAQSAKLRNKVRGSEYSYRVRGGRDGTHIISLYPIPRPGSASSSGSMGIGGGAGTPGTLFYYYYDTVGVAGNPLYSGTTANPGYSGTTDEQGNGLVSGPSDATLYNLTYDEINDVGKTWIKKYTQALSKELLGLGIRGKFSGHLPIPDAELTLNAESLISNGREDKKELKIELQAMLDSVDYKTMLESNAQMQESINKTLSFSPLSIYWG